jgi:hypothetical protein
MVGVVIHALLTDEALRLRYLVDPIGALADLNLRGFELTREEFDVFVQTDARVWLWSSELLGARVH